MIEEKCFRNKVTVFNFMAMYFVILIHTYNLEVYQITPNSSVFSNVVYWLENYVRCLSNLAVPFFFFMSGFLFFRNFTWKDLKRKYISRFFSIFIPYILWCSIYYLYYVAVTHIPFIANHMNDVKIIHLDMMIWLRWLWPDSYYVLWFLKNLIVMIIITPILYIILKNRWHISGWVVLGILFLCTKGIISISLPYFSIYYAVGAFIGINYKNILHKSSKEIVVTARILLIIMLIISGFLTYHERSMDDLLTIIFCAAIWYGVSGSKQNISLPWWMNVSFFIYCAHDMILEGLEKIWLVLGGHSTVAALLDYIFAPLFTIIILIFVAYALKKWMNPLWKLLSGNR